MLPLKYLVSPILLASLVYGQNITYNVITSPSSTSQSVAVVVDNTTFPLSATNEILYSGEAPIAKGGYSYAILENNQINSSEPFSRRPVTSNTPNEFFNRSRNEYQVVQLPQALPELPNINRVESKLHNISQIPTIHLWGNQSEIDFLHKNQLTDIDIRLNMTYIGLDTVQSFEDVKVSLSGRSSRYVPKLSYGVKMKTKGEDSLYEYKKLKLRALLMDPTYLREEICYASLKSAGVVASGFSYIRLFINNKPVGLYGIIETFQDPWLANQFADGDSGYKSGNLYQGVTVGMNQTEFAISDLSYHGENVTKYALGQYKMKAGPGEDTTEGFTDLMEFTKFINETNSNTTVDEWEKHLDTQGFLRCMVLENLLGFSDAYMTMADNYYVYSDPQNTGRMIYIPSDLDTTLGIALFDMNMMTSGNYSEHPGFYFRPLTRKFFSNLEFLDQYQTLLKNLTSSLVNPSVLKPHIESIVNMIQTDIEWDASLPFIGQMVPPPVGNGEDNIPYDLMYPPGYRTNWSDVPQTFESSLYGPTNSTTTESIIGFITRKSNNVNSFYNQRV